MRRYSRGTRPIRGRLTAGSALLVTAALTLVGFLANTLINKKFEEHARAEQDMKAGVIAKNISTRFDAVSGEWETEYVHGVGMAALYDGFVIRLSDSSGRVVWDAEDHDTAACGQVMDEIFSRMAERRPSVPGGFITREYELELEGRVTGELAVQYYSPYFLSESDFSFLESLNLVLVLTGFLALLCSMIAGGFLAGRIRGPVKKTAAVARQISSGNYAARLESGTGISELDELAGAVNSMAASLESQEGLRRRLTGDMAHELRTPLAAVASQLEAMAEGLWETTPERLDGCLEEIGRLTGLVADLENLARAEDPGLKLVRTEVDLMELAKTVAGNFGTQSMRKNITVTFGAGSAVVAADRNRMNQVISNLMSNAIKYTPDNGFIRIEVSDDGDEARIAVEDSGPGIAKEDLRFIFERFYRADTSRSRVTGGAGIGLAVVKSYVAAHGGSVSAQSQPGKGSRFTVILPKQAPSGVKAASAS